MADNKDLNELRLKLNQIDEDLIKLISNRRQLVKEVIKVKKNNNLEIVDRKREQELINKNIELGKKYNLKPEFIAELFSNIIFDSISLQYSLIQEDLNSNDLDTEIGFLSFKDSINKKAALIHYSKDAYNLKAYNKIEDLIYALQVNEIDQAFIEIESTFQFVSNNIYDILLNSQLFINQEKVFNRGDTDYIRYLILSKNEAIVDLRIPAKSAILISIKDSPGALAKVLDIFNEFNINLSKLELKPFKNTVDKLFYIEFEDNFNKDSVKKSIKILDKFCDKIKVLGSFPKEEDDSKSVLSSFKEKTLFKDVK